MSEHKRATWFLIGIHFLLLSCCLAGCGFSGPSPVSDVPVSKVVLSKCQLSFPLFAARAHGSVATQQMLYVTAANRFYALNASDGAVRWCQQLTVTTQSNCPAGFPCPPSAGPLFGTPKIINGVAYVCDSGDTSKLYAFNANNGTLLWQTSTDCGLSDPAFLSYAVPFVQNGIVYVGTYALRASDGAVLLRFPFDPGKDGGLQIQAIEGNTIYGNTIEMVYAFDVTNGKMLWHYDAGQPVSGPLVVDDQRLFAGTSGSSNNPQTSHFFALNTESGTLLWQYKMGNYNGAVASSGAVYVSSSDRHLYAFQKDNGHVLWKHAFASATYLMPTGAGNVLYMNADDGVYALRRNDGAVLWHRSFQNASEVNFTPSLVSNGIIYLAAVNFNRTSNGSEQSTLYALDASSGMIDWQRTYPIRANPFAIA